MKIAAFFCLLILFGSHNLYAQHQVFEFTGILDKKTLAVSALADEEAGTLTLIFADDDYVQYARVDKDFAVGDKIITSNKAVKGEIHAYTKPKFIGGLSSGNISHFFFLAGDKDFYDETVDFSKNTAVANKIGTKPPMEDLIGGYYLSGGRYIYVTANDDTRVMNFYEMTSNGNLQKYHIKYPVAENATSTYSLSRHLKTMKAIRPNDYRSLETGRSWASLYDFRDSINIAVDLDKYIEFVTIDTSTMKANRKKIIPEGYDTDAKGDTWFDTQIMDGKLFTLVTQKDKFTVLTCDLKSGKWNKVAVIDENTPRDNFIQPPFYINTAKSDKEDEISMNEALRKINKGTRAFNVRLEQNKYVLTIGEYDFIPRPTQTSTGGHFAFTNTNVYQGRLNADPKKYFMPTYEGTWVPNNTIGYDINANYYRSVFFEVALDPSSMKLLPPGTGFSKPDLVNAVDKVNSQHATGPVFFTWKNKNYEGSYDAKENKYVVVEIVMGNK
ncbi:MAG: hypothetical protein ABI480_11670 [Chitinophagaceae bacterium]